MSLFHHEDDTEELLKKLIILTCDLIEQGQVRIRQNRRIVSLLQTIAEEEAPPTLASIHLEFEEITMANTVTLTAVGQQANTVLTGTGSDGNPWTGPLPTATYADDNSVVATTDSLGVVTAIANGSDNVTATLTTAEGVSITSNPVTVTVDIAPPPVTLASIQLAFV